jgi:ABC-type transport system involved in multi-copper enzyme maturation permease subunit
VSASTETSTFTEQHPLPKGRYGLRGLIRSEWTKIRTVRSTMWTIGILVVLGVGFSALATALTTANWYQMSRSDRAMFDPTQTSLIGIFFGQLVIGILGVLVVTAEYSTGTVRATFSAAPRRPLVVLAKVTVFGLVAFVVSEFVAFASYFVGQSLLTSPAIHTTLSNPGVFDAVFGSGLYLCVLGLFALGIALVIRHTAGAISTFVGLLLVVPIIVALLPSSFANAVNRYLPAQIGSSIVSQVQNTEAFGRWAGLIVLAGYAVALISVGTALIVRRDA